MTVDISRGVSTNLSGADGTKDTTGSMAFQRKSQRKPPRASRRFLRGQSEQNDLFLVAQSDRERDRDLDWARGRDRERDRDWARGRDRERDQESDRDRERSTFYRHCQRQKLYRRYANRRFDIETFVW